MSGAAVALPNVLAAIRPRPRWRELWLLCVVAVTLTVGAISLGATLLPSRQGARLDPVEALRHE